MKSIELLLYYTVQGAHEPRRVTHVFMSHATALLEPSSSLSSIIPRNLYWLSAYAKTLLLWQNLIVMIIIHIQILQTDLHTFP